jgi:hypothetical protein
VLTLFLARSLRYAFWGSMGAVYGEEARALLQAIDGWSSRHWPFVAAALAAAVLGIALTVRRSRLRAAAEVDGAS